MSEDKAGEFFSISKNIILFVAVYLYFVGWIFAYYFFNHFGISLNAIDIPFYYFFIYSYPIVISNKLLFIFIPIILLIFVVIMFYKKLAYSIEVVLALMFIAFIPIAFMSAKENAEVEAIKMRMSESKSVIFSFSKDTIKYYPSNFTKANSKGKLKLLTQTKDSFYVFYQGIDDNEEIPFGYTFVVSKKDILLANVEMQNKSLRGIR